MKDVKHSLAVVLSNWRQMQTSDMEEAGEDADRFQTSFYHFTQQVNDWVNQLHPRPTTVEALTAIPGFSDIVNALPEPLQIPFETELEVIVAGTERAEDNTQQ